MRIASLFSLCLVVGCFPENVTAASAERLTAPSPAPVTASRGPYGCHPNSVLSGPLLFVIDGAAYREPEDSVWFRDVGKRLQPEDIESIYIIKGVAASQRYGIDRPAVVITTTHSFAMNHKVVR
jgi:hypothetical protein